MIVVHCVYFGTSCNKITNLHSYLSVIMVLMQLLQVVPVYEWISHIAELVSIRFFTFNDQTIPIYKLSARSWTLFIILIYINFNYGIEMNHRRVVFFKKFNSTILILSNETVITVLYLGVMTLQIIWFVIRYVTLPY